MDPAYLAALLADAMADLVRERDTVRWLDEALRARYEALGDARERIEMLRTGMQEIIQLPPDGLAAKQVAEKYLKWDGRDDDDS